MTQTASDDKQSHAEDRRKNLSILKELHQFIQPHKYKVFAALLALVFTAALTLAVGQGCPDVD